MLKCKIDREKGTAKVQAKGTQGSVRTETLVIIKEIHKAIHAQNPQAADEYKRTIIGALIDPKSPVWKIDEPEENSQT